VNIAHQLLFGYDDGQRLLAGSCELPADTLLLLLGATDAAVSAESAPLITGIALPGSDEYAFCVTWPAPEVARAGAVWGHALIVKTAELHDPHRYEALLTLPRRPSGAQPDLAGYLTPLRLDAPAVDVLARLAPRRHDRELLERIVMATYGSSEEAICANDDLVAATRAVLALWGGQSPALRAVFSLRTRQAMRREPSSFDLSVAAKVRGIDEDALPPVSATAPDWVAALVDDLLAPAGTPLRQFLWAFGPAATPDQLPAMRRLAKLWLRVGARDPVGVRSYLERHWPAPGDGAELKRALFGNAQNRWWGVDERTRVRMLLHTANDAWDRDELEVKHRARALGIR
jgi:hypothetical protein